MSSRIERPRLLWEWLPASLLLAASLFLFSVYAEGQTAYTARFLFEVLIFLDQLMAP